MQTQCNRGTGSTCLLPLLPLPTSFHHSSIAHTLASPHLTFTHHTHPQLHLHPLITSPSPSPSPSPDHHPHLTFTSPPITLTSHHLHLTSPSPHLTSPSHHPHLTLTLTIHWDPPLLHTLPTGCSGRPTSQRKPLLEQEGGPLQADWLWLQQTIPEGEEDERKRRRKCGSE